MRREKIKGNTRYILLFLAGMLVFLYPFFSNLYYDYYVLDLQHDEELAFANLELDEDAILDEADLVTIATDPEMTPLLNKNKDYLATYNESLWKQSLSTVDPFGEGEITEDTVPKVSADYSSIFAYIYIPKIDQTLPIYLGATDEHLAGGAAVIQGTSLPIGGSNTNSVISGHTGLVQKFFTDLPELVIGDTITITNRWETMHYRVTGNKLIWPEQNEYLVVVPGKDMITLLTCYDGTVANDRLLVFTERWYPSDSAEIEMLDVQKGDNVDGTVAEATEITEVAENEMNEETIGPSEDYEDSPGQSEIDSSSTPKFMTVAEIQVKPWYKKFETYMIAAALLLVGMLLNSIFKNRKS